MPQSNHLIFVNYRGSDDIWATEFVYARMTEAFGADAVFKAGNAIGPGEVYSPILQEKAAFCPVMLVCMGVSWLAVQDADGNRRLDSPEDWVRREITLSLRAGNSVVPVLFGNHGEVSVPKPAELPDDLSSLIDRQAWRLAPGGGLDMTMPRLIEKLIELEPALGRRRAALRSGRSGPSDGTTPTGDGDRGPDGSSPIFHIDRVDGDVVGRDKVVHPRADGTHL
jgi:hypothetical protein